MESEGRARCVASGMVWYSDAECAWALEHAARVQKLLDASVPRVHADVSARDESPPGNVDALRKAVQDHAEAHWVHVTQTSTRHQSMLRKQAKQRQADGNRQLVHAGGMFVASTRLHVKVGVKVLRVYQKNNDVYVDVQMLRSRPTGRETTYPDRGGEMSDSDSLRTWVEYAITPEHAQKRKQTRLVQWRDGFPSIRIIGVHTCAYVDRGEWEDGSVTYEV